MRQTAHPQHQATCLRTASGTGARLNPSNGGECNGSRDDITTHNMLIKGDNLSIISADPEPQTALF
jgi:hypothetical protein